MHKYTKKTDVLAEWWAQNPFPKETGAHTRAHTAPPAPAELLSQ